ncbi:MAG: hypothetical protein FJ104_08010 [Deltaproteobacteria bacterium]|nr:hypothetical protein [Deltaproteobacteria bacterium]
MKGRLVSLLVSAAVVLDAASALACSFSPPEARTADATVDDGTLAPARPVVTGVTLLRGYGSECVDRGGFTCSDIGVVHLELAPAADDRTPPGGIGYRLVVVGGSLPEGFFGFPNEPFLASAEGLWGFWVDGANDAQEPVDFTLTLAAVDAAGNESVPSAPLRVHDPGRTAATDECVRRSARPPSDGGEPPRAAEPDAASGASEDAGADDPQEGGSDGAGEPPGIDEASEPAREPGSEQASCAVTTRRERGSWGSLTWLGLGGLFVLAWSRRRPAHSLPGRCVRAAPPRRP